MARVFVGAQSLEELSEGIGKVTDGRRFELLGASAVLEVGEVVPPGPGGDDKPSRFVFQWGGDFFCTAQEPERTIGFFQSIPGCAYSMLLQVEMPGFAPRTDMRLLTFDTEAPPRQDEGWQIHCEVGRNRAPRFFAGGHPSRGSMLGWPGTLLDEPVAADGVLAIHARYIARGSHIGVILGEDRPVTKVDERTIQPPFGVRFRGLEVWVE